MFVIIPYRKAPPCGRGIPLSISEYRSIFNEYATKTQEAESNLSSYPPWLLTDHQSAKNRCDLDILSYPIRAHFSLGMHL
jgi:hypothetical protein